MDRVELQKQRELVLQADAQLRRAYNMNAEAMMDSARLSNVELQEKALQEERHHAVLRILQLALADINHHLQLIQNKNVIGEAELKCMQDYLTQILSQSKEAKQKYVLLEQNIRVNLDEYQKKTSVFRDELKLLRERNRKLQAEKEQQDRQLAELQHNLQLMLESEQKISSEWLTGVSELEKKVLGMRETMSITLDQLRESTKLLAQYRVKMQTTKIRIAIEEKVKASYDAANFEKRHKMLQDQLATSQKRQEALTEEIATVQTGWADYYALAIDDIKHRFAEIDKATIMQYLSKQKTENEALEKELTAILGEVQTLEKQITTKSDAQDAKADEYLVRLKQEAEQKQIRFKTLLNRKSVMYAELLMNARILMDMNDQLILNEEAKLKLMEDIDVSTLELMQKRQLALELQQEVNDRKEEYKALKQEIQMLDDKAELYKARMKELEDEYDQMKELLMLRNLEIEQLEKTAGVKAPQAQVQAKRAPASIYYRAVKGDLVDELVEQNLTELECTLPIKRLCDGYYLFGTKKIYIKVHRGRLLLKSGGGFQDFIEYIESYQQDE